MPQLGPTFNFWMKSMTEPHGSRRLRSQQGCADFKNAGRFQRRTLLQAGAIGSLGLGLADFNRLLHASETASKGRRPKAKACIFLFMWGGPSQLDTFDLKPHAPAEVRGEFKPISTMCRHPDLRTL